MIDISNNIDVVREFKRVRDVPYRIPLSPDEPDHTCSGKAGRLQEILSQAGVRVRRRICTFLWKDLRLPIELQNIPHEGKNTHDYLEVKIGPRWLKVDPTWDWGLRELFPVNDWDGISDTMVAMPVIRCFSPAESIIIATNDASRDAMVDDLKKNGEFYSRFNEWLMQNRI